jgi:proline iminopeptidase
MFRTIASFVSLLLLSLAARAATPSVPATTAQDPHLPSISVDGYRFHAQTFGDDRLPVLIVLHGGPGGDHRYLLGLQALSDLRRVVFYDQRGTGLSPRVPAKTISVDGYMADLDAIVQRVSPGRPVDLLGHSWGAMLASAYTGRHPDKVRRLVLAEPGFLDKDTMDAAMGGGWPGWAVVGGMAKAWLSQWLVDTGGDPHARRDWLIGQMMALFQAGSTCDGRVPRLEGWRASGTVYDAMIGRMGEDPAFAASLSFRQGVEAFNGPVLFLTGQCSPRMGEAQQRRHMLHFRQARLVNLPDAGHAMFNDQPAAAMAEVRLFLDAPPQQTKDRDPPGPK